MKTWLRSLLITILIAGVLGTGLAASLPETESEPAAGKEEAAVAARFSDTRGHWAKRYIEQLAAAGIVRGVTEDLYAPDDPVENVQVLVMIVRALGYEEAAQRYQDDPAPILRTAGVPGWARGYLAVARMKDLISDQELAALWPGESASRLDVARFVARLFADDEPGGNADYYPLSDLYELSDDARAFIFPLIRRGIMIGTPDGRWLPYQAVTRGQMAKIMAFISGRLNSRSSQSFYVNGKIEQIEPDDRTVTLQTAAGLKTYALTAEAIIYVNGQRAGAEELSPGQLARLVTAAQGAGYLEARSRTEQDVAAAGLISRLVTGPGAAITVRGENDQETTFSVTDDSVILLGGREVFISDLQEEQPVAVSGLAEQGVIRALFISAEANEEEVAGKIKSVIMHSSPTLTVVDSEEKDHSFSVSDSTSISLNGQAAVLEDLRPEDAVYVRAVDKKALWVQAQRKKPQEESAQGRITALIFGSEPSISVRTDDDAIRTYLIDRDQTSIYVGEERSTLDALKIGWQVELQVLGDTAIDIRAEQSAVR